MDYLIGYFSRRQVFHIVAYRDSDEEVQAFLKTRDSRRLVVYAAQQGVQADGAYWSCLQCHYQNENAILLCNSCHTPRR